MARCSFWKRVSTSIIAFGGSRPAPIVPVSCRRSDTLRCSDT